MIDDIQPTSHPLKWAYLVDTVVRSGLDNPDIWIEDIREYGPCTPEKVECVCKSEGTNGIEASFSTITDREKNRIVIRHHY